MINELHTLADVLKETNIPIEKWHKDYKTLPKTTEKSPCFRIWLNSDGSISNIEKIDENLALKLRKFGDNQSSFPAFNIRPLYKITSEDVLKRIEKMKKDANEIDVAELKTYCVNKNGGLVQKVSKCLAGASKRMMNMILPIEQKEYRIVEKLVEIASNYSSVGNGKNSFINYLEKYIFEQLEKRKNIDIVLHLLFCKGSFNKSKNDDGQSISIILDIADWKKYEYGVTSEHVTKWINEQIINFEENLLSNTKKLEDIDAFGTLFNNPNVPMPNVKINGNVVTLRSMFSGQPCQHRYGKIDDKSYPIASKNRDCIAAAFSSIAGPSFENITWRKIDKDETIFVYPSKLMDIRPQFASLFSPTPINNIARFKDVAKDFIKLFSAIPTEQKPAYINIFSIRKIDKARTKVVFTRNCSSEQFVKAVEEWVTACENIPNNQFIKEVGVFPLQISYVVNNVWKQNGEVVKGEKLVKHMKYYQGVELLLNMMTANMVLHYLQILIINSRGLIIYIGNWQHGKPYSKNNLDVNKNDVLSKETASILAVLGLLLFKNNIRKEIYMECTAYLIGQLLKVSDELHALYCNVVRKGDMPAQLAGSSLFIAASEMPFSTIAQLGFRMNPYIIWAQQYRFKKNEEKNKESWRAGWYLNMYSEIADKLTKTIIDTRRFSDIEKAQLFIGYLASLPKREKQENISSANDNRRNKE